MEDDESGFYVNEVDGLPNDHPALPDYDNENRTEELNPDTFDDLPTSLIVTNIHSTVFVSESLKAEMESLFQQFSPDVTFQWLKSFRRLRVNYVDAVSAGELLFVVVYLIKHANSSYLTLQLTPASNFTNSKSTTR